MPVFYRSDNYETYSKASLIHAFQIKYSEPKNICSVMKPQVIQLIDDLVIVLLFYCAYIEVFLSVIKTEQIHPCGTCPWPP